MEAIRARAQLLRSVRDFFYSREVLEVETPILSCAGLPDPHLHSFQANSFFLHTSPEFPMKRLLASGSGSIYQICKVFRQEEQGRLHNPEFSMLEWYRDGYDYRSLMKEVAQLFAALLVDQIELSAVETISYQDAFLQHTGIDPFAETPDGLMEYLRAVGIDWQASVELDRQALLDLILLHQIEPKLGKGRLTFLIDYPAEQAALARLAQTSQGHWIAERFEVYFQGIELANGYTELANADEQRQRFAADQRYRAAQSLVQIPVDQRFLAALEAGLPACAGVAVGLDRVLMLQLHKQSLAEVIAFPVDRA